jgi:enediyne biosynthesis protein E4
MPQGRSAPLTVAESAKPGFTRLDSAHTRVAFTNQLNHHRSHTNQIYHNGSGVALGDIDGDGLCDIYLGNIDGPNALYRNLGNWRFEEVAARSGVACPDLDTTGVLLADIDGDRDLDLLVNAIGRGTSVFQNDGKGMFRDISASAGMSTTRGAISMASADIDGDGDLDVYVTNYRTVTLRDEPFTQFRLTTVSNRQVIAMVNGKPANCPEHLGRFSIHPNGGILEHGEPDILFRNDGAGKFTPVSWTDGAFLDEDGKPMSIPYDWGLSVMFRDVNGDRAPDIYVCNDFESEDRFWINRGDGRFQLAPRLALRQTSLFSMGVDFADIDRDGRDEFIVVDMLSREHPRRHTQLGLRKPLMPSANPIEDRPQSMRNTLFWNRGDGTYAEIAQFSGVEASEWSWTPIFIDVDLDGYEDLLISNGHMKDAQHLDFTRRIEAMKKERQRTVVEQLLLRELIPRLDNRKLAFRNRGDLTFEEASERWGFHSSGIAQGMATADLDNDGDLDVVVNQLEGPAELYRNDAPAPRVAIRLKDKPGNTAGIGARIKVTGGPVPQSQEMISGGRFLSGDDAIRAFAAGVSGGALTIEVAWREGAHTIITNARPNRIYEIEPAAISAEGPIASLPSEPWFTDASALLNHAHYEQPFDDFARQALLPRKLSQRGPGLCWADLEGNGMDELLVGCSRAGNVGTLLNSGSRFSPVSVLNLAGTLGGDVTTILSVPGSAGGSRFFVGASDFESESAAAQSILVYDMWVGGIDPRPLFSADGTVAGTLACADVDGDGDLDLFAGGVVSSKYPAPVPFALYRKDGEKFVAELKGEGLVNAAVFADLNNDGFPELVTASEWGAIEIYRNERGRFAPWNPALATASAGTSLGQLKGLWNSVAAGDFDGDGRMDLIAGNWGRNCKQNAHLERPLQFYYGDADGDGAVEMIEAYFDRGLGKYVPWITWQTAAQVMPFIQERYTNFSSYSTASVAEILGDRAGLMKMHTANTLDSMVFLNRGDAFEARALPREAQWSPVFGVSVADFDGDGHEDAFLAQNFFGTAPDTSRLDAGRGLLLKGNGRGDFTALTASQSGIAVYGEQRGSAVGDYDGDGRVDLAVAQNGAATKLYKNNVGTGLRVRLAGPKENPSAIGAVLRCRNSTRAGPAREIRAGSGYCSQDSFVQVVSRELLPGLEVRWPGGQTTRSEIPSQAREILVDASGAVKVVR